MNGFAIRKRIPESLRIMRHVSHAILPVLIGVLLLHLSCPLAIAQAQNSGTVVGRITDSVGAVIPGATIVLQSSDQGRTVSTQSNGAGDFVFNSVPISTYSLTITATSFATFTVEHITVNADASVSFNAVLKAGSVENAVTVSADSGAVDTSSATIGTTIDKELVESLPIDGNNAVELAALLPGVTDVNAPTTFTSNVGGPTYNTSGSRANQNLLLLDGSIWNNLYNNTGLNFPPPNSLQEVSVILNNYKAQYGRNVGSVFNVLTRSGSNQFHGSVWEFAQNAAFNATDYISHANPHLVQNQFGFAVGGPIKHNRAFASLSFQSLLLADTVIATAQTPTLNQRGLTSSGTPLPCATAAYAGHTCASFQEDGVTTWNNPVFGTNTSTGTNVSALNTPYQVAGGTGTSPCVTLLLSQPTKLQNPEIPDICWNPVSRALLSVMPVPTLYTAGSTIPLAVTAGKQPRNDKGGLIRIDWNLGRHVLDARYYQTAADDTTANGVSLGQGIATYDQNRNLGAIHFGSMGDTWVISSNVVNVARIGYKRYAYSIAPMDTRTLSSFGAVYTQPGDSLPQIVIAGRAGMSLGSSTNADHSVDEDVEVDDSLSWSHGVHNLQFGAEYLRLQYLNLAQPSLYANFNNTYTPDPIMDFTLGLLNRTSEGNQQNTGAIQHDVYLYAQDDWRATSRLTVNLGLRYELPFQWYQANGQAATFIPGFSSQVFPSAPMNYAFVGDRGIERSLVGTSFNNIAPRVGFAYDAYGNGQTSVRGGFGIFYDSINALVVGLSQPYVFSGTVTANPGGLSEPLLDQPAVPANYSKGQTPQFVSPYSITFPDHNFRPAYTQAFNIGVQQRLARNTVFELNYVGRLSRHLALGYDLNPAIYDCSGPYFQISPTTYCTGANTSAASYQARAKYPSFNTGGSGVLDYTSEGSASYNALQTILTNRASKSLTAILSYTWSKSIDDSSNGTSIKNTTDQPSISVHRAVSDFNAHQIFNVGVVYKLPVVHYALAPLRAVLNNWGVSGIVTARTGHPFGVTVATDWSLRDETPEYASFVTGGYTPLSSGRTVRGPLPASLSRAIKLRTSRRFTSSTYCLEQTLRKVLSVREYAR